MIIIIIRKVLNNNYHDNSNNNSNNINININIDKVRLVVHSTFYTILK